MTNYQPGLELTQREKDSLLRESVILITFQEDGVPYQFVTSIGMLDEADIDWRSDKYRVFGVEVEDITMGRLIGIADAEPPRDTAWEDVLGGTWHFKNNGWHVDDTFMGQWPRVENAFPMKRVKYVEDSATV